MNYSYGICFNYKYLIEYKIHKLYFNFAGISSDFKLLVDFVYIKRNFFYLLTTFGVAFYVWATGEINFRGV